MQHIQLEIRTILNEVSKETGIDYKTIEDIYVQEFEFIRDCIEAGEKDKPETFNNILIRFLGSFIANKKRVLRIKEAKERVNDRRNNREVEPNEQLLERES